MHFTVKGGVNCLWASAALGTLTMYSLSANAQDADEPAKVEEIVVTGSLLRGVQPVGSSLISVGHAEISASPAPTVGEFMKNVPQVLGLGVDPGHKAGAGSVNVGYGSSINLRGLSPGATLLLYNGQRLPRSGGAGTYVDNSSIPGIAIERIEVVADGASAIYGSDAVAGVVNLITRRSFSGLELNVQGNVADSNSGYAVSGIGGQKWSTGGFMIAAEYNYQDRLRVIDRDFARTSDLRSRGGSDLRNTTCSPGNVTQNGVTYTLPNLTPGVTRCDTIQYNDLFPRQERMSVLAHVEQQITDSILFEVDGFFNRREYNYQMATGSTRGGAPAAQNLAVPVSNAYYRAIPGVTPGTQTVNSFLGGALGLRLDDEGPEETWDVTTGLKVDLTPEWRLGINATIGRNWNKADRAGINNANLNAALASSNPATAINPYAPDASTPAAVVASILDFTARTLGRNEVDAYKAQVDGPLFNLPGGAVKVAIGAEYRRESYWSLSLQGSRSSLTGRPYFNERDVQSYYAEANVPLVSAENDIAGVQELTLSLAARQEHYSDFGDTFNPKFGLTWEPADGFVFRGSVGRSFRAPDQRSLAPIGPASAVIFTTVSDPRAGGAAVTIAGLAGGNPDLQPERAKTYSFGLDFTPTFAPGLSGSLTYFKIEYSDVISGAGGLAQEALFPNLISRDPAVIQAGIDNFISRGAIYIPGPPTSLASVAALVNGTPQNLGSIDLDGFDGDLSYRWTQGALGDLEVGVVGSYYTSYEVAASDLATPVENVNTYGYPPRLRLRGHVGWDRGPFTLNAYYNHTSGYRYVAQNRNVSAFDTVDLDGSINLADWVSNQAFSDTRITLSVSNLLDKDPPFFNGYYGYDAQIASAIGRRFGLSVTTKF